MLRFNTSSVSSEFLQRKWELHTAAFSQTQSSASDQVLFTCHNFFKHEYIRTLDDNSHLARPKVENVLFWNHTEVESDR
jgi:hypothetical protein